MSVEKFIFEDYINKQYTVKPNQLTLKNNHVRNGRLRVNTLKISVKDDAVIFYLNTGHDRTTGEKYYSIFVCDKGNIEKLKEFIGKLE